MPASSWRMLWFLLALIAMLVEGIALGRPERGDSLSEAVRFIRFDAVGRYVLIPLWVWLSWHWIVRPDGAATFSWRDLVAIALGIAAAIAETSLRHR